MSKHEDIYNGRSDRYIAKRRSLTLTLLDAVMLLASICIFALMCISLVVPIVDPSVGWIFTVVGLVAPGIYLGALISLLYWIIRWKWRMILIIGSICLLSIPRISLFAKMDLTKHYDESYPRGSFKFTTFNVKNFISDQGEFERETFAEYFNEQKPDILCMQEYNEITFKDYIPTTLKGYNRLNIGNSTIWSHFPIIKNSENLLKKEPGEGAAFWADLVIHSDTVRVFVNHLRTTDIKAQDNEYISSGRIIADTTRREMLSSMVSRVGRNSVIRADQADTIAMVVANTRYPKIVCGDFNDTPLSYTYHKLSRKLTDAFRNKGEGYSNTYRGFLGLLRIDYILVSEPIEVLSYEVDHQMDISDHYPVTSHLKIY